MSDESEEDQDYYEEDDEPTLETDDKKEDPEYFKYEELKPPAAQQLLRQTVFTLSRSLKLHWSLTEMLLMVKMWDEKAVKQECEHDYLKTLSEACIIPVWASEERGQSNNNRPPTAHVHRWPLQNVFIRDSSTGNMCQCCYTPAYVPDSWDKLSNKSSSYSKTSFPGLPGENLAPICREDLTHLYSLLCGCHFFCLPCWRLYLHHQLQVTTYACYTSRMLECMGHSCQVRIPYAFAHWILNEPRLVCEEIGNSNGESCYERYEALVLFDLIQSHPHMRLCPNNCNNVFRAIDPLVPKHDTWSKSLAPHQNILPLNEAPQSPTLYNNSDNRRTVGLTFTVKSYNSLRILCSECDKEACFLCGAEYHAPTDCDTLTQWTRKCLDDSETANYISAHTKDCPKCHVCIEKSGGCNHMNCAKCGYNFCWMCLGDWKAHSAEYYECSRYRENPNIANEAQHVLARKALKKYIFYYERWANHEKSLRLENEQSERIRLRINEKVNQKEGTWIDWQYLIRASDTLRRCRNTLKHTYPFAFYMDRGPHINRKELFEYKQGLLEAEVENLSWKIEHAEIHDRGSLEQKMDVCEKHRIALLHEFFLP